MGVAQPEREKPIKNPMLWADVPDPVAGEDGEQFAVPAAADGGPADVAARLLADGLRPEYFRARLHARRTADLVAVHNRRNRRNKN